MQPLELDRYRPVNQQQYESRNSENTRETKIFLIMELVPLRFSSI